MWWPSEKPLWPLKGPGRLETLAVEEGSRVKKGQILARLENADLQAQAAQAHANLNAAQANLNQIRAGVTNDRLRFERYRKLIKAQAVFPIRLRRRRGQNSAVSGLRVCPPSPRSKRPRRRSRPFGWAWNIP